MNIGIYCIFFNGFDNMYYIGCSSNLPTRIQWHLSMLTSLKHTNKGLQQAFIDYGEPTVEILEYCTLEVLKDREIYWIKEFNSFISGFDSSGWGFLGFSTSVCPPHFSFQSLSVLR